jgi:hypothetical protein
MGKAAARIPPRRCQNSPAGACHGGGVRGIVWENAKGRRSGMESGICIVLLILLILCFSVLLAWLAARDEGAESVRLTVLPAEKPGGSPAVELRTQSGSVILSVCGAPAPLPGEVSSLPPDGGEDPV